MLTKGSLGEREFVWPSVSDHSPSFQERQGKVPSSQSHCIRSIRSQEQRENEPVLARLLLAGLFLSDTIQGPLLKEWYLSHWPVSSYINEQSRHCPTDMPMGQADLENSSFRLSCQVIVGGVKFIAKTKQHKKIVRLISDGAESPHLVLFCSALSNSQTICYSALE